MSKIIALTSFLFFVIDLCPVLAQSDTIRWHRGVKLHLNDFSIRRSVDIAYVDVQIGYEVKFEVAGGGKYLAIVTSDAIFDRGTSSLPDSAVNALRYAQLIFDITGYQSKLYKVKAFEMGEMRPPLDVSKEKLNQLFSEVNLSVSELTKDMLRDFSVGLSDEILSRWEIKVADLVRLVPEIVEDRKVRNPELGVFLGPSYHAFSGKTQRSFANAGGINFGFNVDISRSRMEMDGSLCFNRTKRMLTDGGEWPQGMKTNFASLEFTYGVKLNKSAWLMVPYAGLGINEFSPAKSEKDESRRIVGYSPVLGFELNRIFKRMDDAYEKVSFFYRLKVSVNPSNLVKNHAGTQFNVKLAVGFDVARTKKRLRKIEQTL